MAKKIRGEVVYSYEVKRVDNSDYTVTRTRNFIEDKNDFYSKTLSIALSDHCRFGGSNFECVSQ